MQTHSTCFVGIDAGGTKTRLLASLNGDGNIYTKESGGSNIHRTGFIQSLDIWINLLQSIPVNESRSPGLELVIGVSGSGQEADKIRIKEALESRLKGVFNPINIVVLSDIELALYAGLGKGSGMVLISGTGSIVMARTRKGKIERAGGWGYLLGDEGGGYRLGLEALQSIVRTMDRNQPNELSRKLCTRHRLCNASGIVNAIYQKGFPIASVAPLLLEVAEDGDETARSILRRQLFQLAQTVHILSQRTADLDHRLACVGGLIQNHFYNEVLRDALQEVVPGWHIFEPPLSPVQTALKMAGYSRSSAEG